MYTAGWLEPREDPTLGEGSDYIRAVFRLNESLGANDSAKDHSTQS